MQGEWLTISDAKRIALESANKRYGLKIATTDINFQSACEAAGIVGADNRSNITRGQFAVLIDHIINPFMRVPINHQGEIQSL